MATNAPDKNAQRHRTQHINESKASLSGMIPGDVSMSDSTHCWDGFKRKRGDSSTRIRSVNCAINKEVKDGNRKVHPHFPPTRSRVRLLQGSLQGCNASLVERFPISPHNAMLLLVQFPLQGDELISIVPETLSAIDGEI
jgi:hypothetical protein